jgi:hypothetical protein
MPISSALCTLFFSSGGRMAEAQHWHHLRQLRLRGRQRVNIEWPLIAACQNLKHWLRAVGWGRWRMRGGAV